MKVTILGLFLIASSISLASFAKQELELNENSEEQMIGRSLFKNSKTGNIFVRGDYNTGRVVDGMLKNSCFISKLENTNNTGNPKFKIISTNRDTLNAMIANGKCFEDKDGGCTIISSYYRNKEQVISFYRPAVYKYDASGKRISTHIDTVTKQPNLSKSLKITRNSKGEIFALSVDTRQGKDQIVSLIKYDNNGKFISDNQLDVSKNYHIAKGITIDSQDNIYVMYNDLVKFPNRCDIVIKYNGEFKKVWDKTIDYDDKKFKLASLSIKANKTGGVYIGGRETVAEYKTDPIVIEIDQKDGSIKHKHIFKKYNAVPTNFKILENGGVLHRYETHDAKIGDKIYYLSGFRKYDKDCNFLYEYEERADRQFLGNYIQDVIQYQKNTFVALAVKGKKTNVLVIDETDSGSGVRVQSDNSLTLKAWCNHGLNINYSIEKAASVKLTISDYLGNQISSESFPNQIAGDHEFKLDKDLPNGAYLVSMEVGGQILTKKVMVVK